MQLPRSLTCLTLEYVITDADTIEKYLSIDPEDAEYCIPIALRNLLKPYADKAGMLSSMLTKDMTIPPRLTGAGWWRCLIVLWKKGHYRSEKPNLAVRYGAMYLLPYLDAIYQSNIDRGIMLWEYKPDYSDMTAIATAYGNLPFLTYMCSKYNMKFYFPSSILYNAAIFGRKNIVLYILCTFGKLISDRDVVNAINGIVPIYTGEAKPEIPGMNYFLVETGRETGSARDYQDIINILHYFKKYKSVPPNMCST